MCAEPSIQGVQDGHGVQVVQVVGAALVCNGLCLAAQRSEQMPLPLKWEFPGGKVEPGEDPADALRRELLEELDLVVEVTELVGVGCSKTNDRSIELSVYRATISSGEIRLREHRDFGWFDADELTALDWAVADVPIVPLVCALLPRLP